MLFTCSDDHNPSHVGDDQLERGKEVQGNSAVYVLLLSTMKENNTWRGQDLHIVLVGS
jgi:hypothetical protein